MTQWIRGPIGDPIGTWSLIGPCFPVIFHPLFHCLNLTYTVQYRCVRRPPFPRRRVASHPPAPASRPRRVPSPPRAPPLRSADPTAARLVPRHPRQRHPTRGP